MHSAYQVGGRSMPFVVATGCGYGHKSVAIALKIPAQPS
jgi:hypothetical protein